MMYFKAKFKTLLSVVLLLVAVIFVYGCFPKTHLTSYSDENLNPANIQKVVIVLEDLKTNPSDNLLFAEIFTQSVIEKKKFSIIDNKAGADALLSIALTHSHRSDRSPFSPTSVGAYAKLIDKKTEKMLWNANYAYTSFNTGFAAPPVEKAMNIVSQKLLELIPLEYYAGSAPGYNKPAYITASALQSSGKALQKINDELSKKISSLQSDCAVLNAKVQELNSVIADKSWGSRFSESQTPPVKADKIYNASQNKTYSLQVGAFRSREYAEDRKKLLIDLGYVARIVQIPDKRGGIWYTVRMSDYDSKEDAMEEAAAFSEKENIKAAVMLANTL